MGSLLDVRPVVVITGISAAGKSTVGELLARRFGRGVHVRGDVFRRMVVAGRAEMTADPSEEAIRQLELRYRLGAATADQYHEAGFAVVLQDVILGPALAGVAGMIRSRPLVVVVLAPEAAAVERRERERNKTAYGEGSPTIAELDHALRRDTPRIGLWLDTSGEEPADTVDRIVVQGLSEGRYEP